MAYMFPMLQRSLGSTQRCAYIHIRKYAYTYIHIYVYTGARCILDFLLFFVKKAPGVHNSYGQRAVYSSLWRKLWL